MSGSASEPTLPGSTVVNVAAAPATAPAVTPAPSVTLTEATFLALLKQAGATGISDVEKAPSKLLVAVKALPSEFGRGVKYVNWPLVITMVVAGAALALHFVKLPL